MLQPKAAFKKEAAGKKKCQISDKCSNNESWRQLELSPDFQSLPTQNIYIEKLVGRDWKKEELGESSNYYIISKTVAHLLN
jgi:hypothetical protein